MLATTCYPREQLQQYLYGLLDDPLSEKIEEHLSLCTRCEDTVVGLEATSDTLMRNLRLQKAGDDALPEWLERVAQSPSCEVPDRGVSDPLTLTRMDDYELLDVIGRGGMSVVFAARHLHLGRDVALKVLLPTYQQFAVSRDRFAREMRAIGALQHPAIVHATDGGQYEDTLYLVMERVDGLDLNEVSRRLGPLSASNAAQIALEVAAGLEHAHREGVVHRDIKPSNVMLNQAGRVKILDFGLARIQSPISDVSVQTTIGQLLGTLDYMAPEQCTGSDVEDSADIYSLGATLFKLLSGSPPHGRSAGQPVLAYLNRVANTPSVRLSEYRSDLPEILVETIAQMLSLIPSDRPSAVEVSARFRALAEDANLASLCQDAVNRETARGADTAAEEARSTFASIFQHHHASSNSEKSLPPKTDSDQGWGGWLVATLLGGLFLAFFGIVLVLQTDQGEIRIESNIDDVQVEIVQDGRVVDALQIERGSEEVRLRSGKYQIRLKSPSDSIEIKPEQVTITRSGKTIAKIQQKTQTAVTKSEPQNSPAPGWQSLGLQLRLADLTRELTEARGKYGREHPRVQSLVKQLSSLQSASRPAPSEPVYDGSPLKDWVARMRFEQQQEARNYAAKCVAELASTRSGAEGVEIALEAGRVLLSMQMSDSSWDEEFDNELYDIVSGGTRSLGVETKHILDIPLKLYDERQADAESVLIEELTSTERIRRAHAMLLLARKALDGSPLPEGRLLSALEQRLEDRSARSQTVARTVLAQTTSDKREAARVLTSADATAASNLTILSWFEIVARRNLDVSRGAQLRWLTDYVANSRDTSYLAITLDEPQLGPFQDLDWDRITATQRREVSSVFSRLLKEMTQALDSGEEVLQPELGAMSLSLCWIVERMALEDETKNTAIRILKKRLATLIQYNERKIIENNQNDMDTPSQLAVALILLSGQVPAEVRAEGVKPLGYHGKQLEELESIVRDPRNATEVLRNMSGNNSASNWFPYQVWKTLAGLHANRRLSPRGGGLLGMTSRFTRNQYLVHPVLGAAFTAEAVGSPDETRFTNFFSATVRANSLTLAIRRHPVFARLVDDWMRKAENHDAAMNMLQAAWGDEAYVKHLKDYLKDSDDEFAFFAVRRLEEFDEVRFRTDWSHEVALTLGRLLEKEHSEPYVLVKIEELGPAAAPAIPSLVRVFDKHLDEIGDWLEVVAIQKGRQEHSFRPFMMATTVLLAFPAESATLLPKLRARRDELVEAAEAQGRASSENSELRFGLEQLIQSIVNHQRQGQE